MKLNKEELQEIMETVGTVLGQADAFLTAGEEIVKTAKPTLTKALKLLLKTGIDVRKEMEKELAELSKIKAQALYRDYKNYTEAGFGKTEAFKLILASIKPVNFSETLNKASSLAKKDKR